MCPLGGCRRVPLGVRGARLGQLYSQPWVGPGWWEGGGEVTPLTLLGAQQPDGSLSPSRGLSRKGTKAVWMLLSGSSIMITVPVEVPWPHLGPSLRKSKSVL